MTAKTMAEVIREELRKGSYQMPGDTLPYETQAAAVAAHLTAAGFGLVADAGALRTELVEYVELLEHLDANDEGIDGDAVPRELRDILNRTAEASS